MFRESQIWGESRSLDPGDPVSYLGAAAAFHLSSLPSMATVATWGDILMSINPYSYAAFGIGASIGFSVAGAAWSVH